MRHPHHMKSHRRYQCLALSKNIRNIDRTEDLGPVLSFELSGPENIGIAEFEMVSTYNKTQNDIAHKGIFIHAVAFFEGIPVKKDIPIDSVADQVNETMDSLALPTGPVIGLF